MLTREMTILSQICKCWRRKGDVAMSAGCFPFCGSIICSWFPYQLQLLSPELRGIWEIPTAVQTDACDDSEHISGIRRPGLDKSCRPLQKSEVLWRSQASESGLVILSLTNLLDTKDWFSFFSSCSRKVMAAEPCNLPSSGHTICQPQLWEW